jgi:beta-xylosidase
MLHRASACSRAAIRDRERLVTDPRRFATARRLAKSLVLNPWVADALFRIDRRLHRLRGSSGEERTYAIGVLRGTEPLSLQEPDEISNPVIHTATVTDMDAGLVADPFWIRHEDVWWMFFEAYNNHARKGEIACARSADGMRWTYVGRVLRERFHLSYPQLFRHGGEMYLIPESAEAESVRLYRALEFPRRWRAERTLLRGKYVDPSVFEADGRWWMLAMRNEGEVAEYDLHLFWAEAITGPWHAHRQNPIVRGDDSRARPAGRVVVQGDRIIRFSQVCRPQYGTAVRAWRITELSPERYEEELVGPDPLLTGSGTGWNADGMHHIDAMRLEEDRWLACVDGWVHNEPARPQIAREV